MSVATILLAALGALPMDSVRSWILLHEDLEVFLDPSAGRLELEGRLTARLDRAESAEGLDLLINARAPLMRFEEVEAEGATVELNEQDAEFDAALVSRLHFSEPRKEGDVVEVAFRCSGKTRGRQLVVAKEAAFASWVEAWYPMLPREGGTALSDAARSPGTTTFHLPPGWHAVSNGALVSSDESETETVEVWSSDAALARSFAAGPYRIERQRVGDLEVALYLLSEGLPTPRANVESLALALEAMEERLGSYPYSSYAIAEAPAALGAFGASSEQGFILVKPNFLQVPGGNLPLFAHEAAHGWWGNTVGTSGPGGILCSESLAQYGAVMAAERAWGVTGATELLRFSRPGYVPDQCARGYFELCRLGRDRPMSQLESGGGIDHTLADAKGHWVFHMLRHRVGDEFFFEILRELIDEYRGRSMTLDDVRDRFLEFAPDADLEPFFEQWLDRTGAPVLSASFENSKGGVEVEIRQHQPGPAFDLWLDLRLHHRDGGVQDERVHVTETVTTASFGASSDVVRVELDPEHAILKWEPEYGDPPVDGVPDWLPAPVDSSLLAACAGTYRVPPDGPEVEVAAAQEQLTLTVAGRTETLVHTGETRFRSADGFVVFRTTDGPANSLIWIRDDGGTRVAVRQR